ncbi:MAG: DUF4910 domain-containing protein [Anaerolineales bacterium]|nr:DUF4910 domain-containing protein [Anaerolineales bacterium]
MVALMTELYPICRSITGDGVRASLRMLQRHIPLHLHEVPTGTPVFDWIVPREWNIRNASITTAAGETIVDIKQHSLHILNYSVPIDAWMSLEALRPHLFTLPDHPDWIPYRTSYYAENWGFCITQRTLDSLVDTEYHVVIDSTLGPGHLTFGELVLPGESAQEVLVSCHCCHPSLCNDNLSGMVLATFLARVLSTRHNRYTYRFLFVPGTIGAITWLALNEPVTARIAHGLVVACVGDAGHMHYKRSRRGDAEIDRAVEHVLRGSGKPYAVRDFSPYGYDERQYCSPGFNLPVGSLSRTPHGQFPEYHTSADNLDFVHPANLADSLATYLAVVNTLEHNRVYVNTNPKCEPQLGRRGLYSTIGGRQDTKAIELAMLWVLNLSDGQHALLDIAERAGIDFGVICEAASHLKAHQLLVED